MSQSMTMPARVPSIGPWVAIVNQSTVLTDAQVAPVVAALQIQIDRDFAPIWNLGANLIQVLKGQAVTPGHYVLTLLDDSDQPDALGYHDITNDGLPIGRVFVKTDMRYGLSWSITMSHELLEILVDPYVNSSAFIQDTATTGTLYAYEVCDAVEDDTLGYAINGVMVSDFVTPAWWETFRAPGSTMFSFKSHVSAPLALAPGGYIAIFPVRRNTRGWTQKFAQGQAGKRALNKSAKSRTTRRLTRS